jgi:hypothetical membrane protein
MLLLRKLSAGAFLAGSAVYLAAEAITAAAWNSPTYSYADNFISDLGSATSGTFQGRELNSPLHAVMNSGFIVQGVLFGIATVLLARVINGQLQRFTTAMGVLITIGYLMVGTFHGSLQAQQNGTLPLHFTGATLAILGANLLAVRLGIFWRRTSETRRLGVISLALGTLGLVAATVLGLTFDADVPSGLIERVSVYTIVAWELAVAVTLLRQPAGTVHGQQRTVGNRTP